MTVPEDRREQDGEPDSLEIAASSPGAGRVAPARGLVMVFTGEGKGKTTSALGMALRAAGHGYRVKVIQFVKGTWRTGESMAVARLAPELELVRTGRGFTIEGLASRRITRAEHVAAAGEGLELAQAALASGEYRMVVLDEILYALRDGLVSLADLLALIAARPPDVHLVLTGRGAPPEVVEAADLVTELRAVKHPHTAGIPAQKGVEY